MKNGQFISLLAISIIGVVAVIYFHTKKKKCGCTDHSVNDTTIEEAITE